MSRLLLHIRIASYPVFLQSLVGNTVLSEALDTLISTNTTSTAHVFGCLLVFFTNNSALCNLFADVRDIGKGDNWSAVDSKVVASVDFTSTVLHHTIGIVTMAQLLHLASPAEARAVVKIIDRFVHSGHQNQARLNRSGIIILIFQLLHCPSSSILQSESSSLTKSLKRLLEMGAPIEESRLIFKSMLKPSEATAGRTSVLDTLPLDLIKSGIRVGGKWPSFLAFEADGNRLTGLSIPRHQLSGRTFPGSAGFTLLVKTAFPLSSRMFPYGPFFPAAIGVDLH